MKKILIAFGTRPEAIKMAPLILRLKTLKKEFTVIVCVTAQHRQMLDDVLNVFKIKPNYDLNIMEEEQTLYHITATVLLRMEKILHSEKPDLVLVHGDTTSTFAVALSSFYQKIPVGHVEAGLRSYNKYHPFPEEANRILTDTLCDLYFAPTMTAKKALLKENISEKKIFITGNTVIDALYSVCNKPINKAGLINQAPTKNQKDICKYILATVHRRENFGKPLENIFNAFRKFAKNHSEIQIVYPVHPNANVQLIAKKILGGIKNIRLLPPQNYLDFALLLKSAYFVVTDSGGLQEEAPAVAKPVLVLREVTERPEAVKSGNVRIIGTDEEKILSEMEALLNNKLRYKKMSKAANPYGDGKASERIIEAIRYYFKFRLSPPQEFM